MTLEPRSPSISYRLNRIPDGIVMGASKIILRGPRDFAGRYETLGRDIGPHPWERQVWLQGQWVKKSGERSDGDNRTARDGYRRSQFI